MGNNMEKLINFFGNKTAVGRALGVTHQAVIKWERTQVPADRAIQIEQLTNGAVTVRDLRPDLFETTAA